MTVHRTGIDFLKLVTYGLLNKYGVSFKLLATTLGSNRKITIDMTFGKTLTTSCVPSVQLSYYDSPTDEDYSLSITFADGVKSLRFGEKPYVDKAWDILVQTQRKDFSRFIPSKESGIDIYGLLESLSEEIFNSDVTFELNSCFGVVNIHNYVPAINVNGVLNSRLLDLEYRIHGGIGTADSMLGMHEITFSAEYVLSRVSFESNLSKETQKGYLVLCGDITDTGVRQGIQLNPTLDHLRELVLYQYKNTRPLSAY